MVRTDRRRNSSALLGIVVLWISVATMGVARASEVSNEPISFVNDIVPVLTKAGCNSGVCHAKAGGGQNGFELSLLGFEPLEDYDHMVLEGRGRRLFPAAPDQSLLLRKVSGRTPHGGGILLPPESKGYHLLRRWIVDGTPLGDTSVELRSLEVQPPHDRIQPGASRQLKAIAHYEDGSTRIVTELALFESNDRGMATVTGNGLVTASDLPGRVGVMVRYQGRVSVFNAAIPLGTDAETPKSNNFIDDHVFANLSQIGIPASEVCDDSTFLRRVTLDIAGRLPTADEAREFLTDASPQKRAVWIDRLLKSPSYADYFANKWTALLKNRRDDASDITSNFAFHAWVRDSLLTNVPYDQMVRELLAATGTVIANPAVAWYKRVKEPKQQMEDVAQLFLGVRMQCAQCHHHPFERWSQDDYYGLSAFFTRVGRKPTGIQGEDLIFHKRGLAEAKNIKTGEMISPAALGDAVGVIAPDEDPRLRLANWLSDPSNPFFSKALVNRYWKHFFKRGLIEPEDDIRDTNPATNPELLSALEDHFLSSGFDLKELVRAITNSRAYQLRAVPSGGNAVDRQNYSRFYPRRLQAEVLLDAIDELTGATTNFANLPIGTKAIALPDNSYNKSSPFLRVFGRPESLSVCECERVQSASLAQSLHLMNASDLRSKLAVSGGMAQELAALETPLADRVTSLYFAAFSRAPTDVELKVSLEFLSPKPDGDETTDAIPTVGKAEFEDLIWALINTKEFLFNH
ncbi:MAG: DUF1549 domain-containing protein [Planctomycetaceae bacterium]|nr:DUF1549 domain-containing protein [Planctomycetaceae bacterium]